MYPGLMSRGHNSGQNHNEQADRTIMKLKITLLISCLTCWLTNISAQMVLSLHDAVLQAENESPDIKSAQAETVKKSQAYKLSGKASFPELNIYTQSSFGTFNNITGMYIPQNGLWPISGPPAEENMGQPAWGSVAGVGFNWEPFTFGKRKNQVLQSQAEYRTSQYEAELVTFKHLAEVIQQYLTVLAAEKKIEVFKLNEERASETYKLILPYTQNGLKPGIDTALAKGEISKARISLQNSVRSFKIEKSRLTELINLSGNYELDQGVFYDQLPVNNSRDSLKHPLIAVFESRTEQQQSGLKVFRKEYYPDISLTGTYYLRGSGVAGDLTADHGINAGFNFERYNYGIGLAVSLPVLDFSINRNRIRMQEAELSSSRFQLESRKLFIEQQQRSASVQFNYALSTAEEMPLQFQLAQYAYEMMKARYQSGLVNLQELIQTQYLLVEAQTNLINARIDAWRALIQMAVADGDLNIFLDQIGN